ncbi:MAG: response regulator [Tannerellaceae bacterium]|jgi:DNA-binding NarL/FixJ family response regulator|nr:response regulator [Tannerellaceae bacterium]
MIEVFITTGKDERLTERLRSTINESKDFIVTGIYHKLGDCREKLETLKKLEPLEPLEKLKRLAKLAKEKSAHNIPNILLLGLAMRDGNGIDFCTEIREKYPDIKILMLTDNDEYSITRRALDNGALGFIRKNALPEELMAGLNAVWHGQKCIGGRISIQKNGAPVAPPEWLTKILKSIQEDCTNQQEQIERLSLLTGAINKWRKMLIIQLLADNKEALDQKTMNGYIKILTENLFIEGYSNWEIVDELHKIADNFSIDTDAIRIYRMSLIQKLGEKNSMMFAKKTDDVIRLKPDDILLIRLVAAGFTTEEIAKKLSYVGVEAVKSRRKKLIQETGTRNMLVLIIDALRQGLIKLEDIDIDSLT